MSDAPSAKDALDAVESLLIKGVANARVVDKYEDNLERLDYHKVIERNWINDKQA